MNQMHTNGKNYLEQYFVQHWKCNLSFEEKFILFKYLKDRMINQLDAI